MSSVSAFKHRYGFGREDVGLANWRTRPYSTWSFQSVEELVPSVTISVDPQGEDGDHPSFRFLGTERVDVGRGPETMLAFLERSDTDRMLVMKSGRVVAEYLAPHSDRHRPHLVFSITKSLTAIVIGALESRRLLDRNAPVADYLPQVGRSGYAGCTIQHLFDMRACIDFDEKALDPGSPFGRYRRAMLWDPMRANMPAETVSEVILSIGRGAGPHGGPFRYCSPNFDLLGLVAEAASGIRMADLYHDLFWQPLRGQGACAVTVDAQGTARSGGGISMTAHDLGRVGQMMLDGGMAGSRPLVPGRWIEDTLTGGDHGAWRAGDMADLLPGGRYRNGWYDTGLESRAFFAAGLHGQWLYCDPSADLVVVRLSSQTVPSDETLDRETLNLFRRLPDLL